MEVGGTKTRRLVGTVRNSRVQPRVARPVVRPGDRPEDRPETSQAEADHLWDVAGAAAYLQVPTSAIYKMTARKAAVRIPHIRLGGKLRFRRADVDRWLTLLTTSNVDALARVRSKTQQVIHGNHSQTEIDKR